MADGVLLHRGRLMQLSLIPEGGAELITRLQPTRSTIGMQRSSIHQASRRIAAAGANLTLEDAWVTTVAQKHVCLACHHLSTSGTWQVTQHSC